MLWGYYFEMIKQVIMYFSKMLLSPATLECFESDSSLLSRDMANAVHCCTITQIIILYWSQCFPVILSVQFYLQYMLSRCSAPCCCVMPTRDRTQSELSLQNLHSIVINFTSLSRYFINCRTLKKIFIAYIPTVIIFSSTIALYKWL